MFLVVVLVWTLVVQQTDSAASCAEGTSPLGRHARSHLHPALQAHKDAAGIRCEWMGNVSEKEDETNHVILEQ